MIPYSYIVGGLLLDGLAPEQEQDKLNRCSREGWELVATSKRKINGHEYVIHYFKRAIRNDTPWREEVYEGKMVWQGLVEVFTLQEHPKAKRAYAWSHVLGEKGADGWFVTVLELPLVVSPETAVKVAVASGENRAA